MKADDILYEPIPGQGTTNRFDIMAKRELANIASRLFVGDSVIITATSNVNGKGYRYKFDLIEVDSV